MFLNLNPGQIPVTGGISGFLGGTKGTFFSGTTSLGASSTLKILVNLHLSDTDQHGQKSH